MARESTGGRGVAEEQCEWEQCANGTKREDNTHTTELPLAVGEGQRKRKLCWHFSGGGKTQPGRGNNLGHCLASPCLAMGCLVVLHASCHTPGVPFVVQLFHGLKN